jgi:hypothetical protein
MSFRRVGSLVTVGLLMAVIAPAARAQNPECGNGVTEVFEQCDGADSTACAAGCLPNCFCAPLCSPSPIAGCRKVVPGKGNLKIVRDFRSSSPVTTLDWTWQYGDATTKNDFGNPTNTEGPFFAFCVYDGSFGPQPKVDSTIPPGGTLWKEYTQYFKYLDPNSKLSNEAVLSHGIKQVKLTPGAQRRASILVQSRPPFFSPPVLPLSLPVVVQFQRVERGGSSPLCWEVQYTTPTRNDGLEFLAKGP